MLQVYLMEKDVLIFSKCRNVIYPRVTISNTNLEIIESLRYKFGGFITKSIYRKEWKQGYHWTITNKKAVDFLESIEPWIKIKKQQIYLAFCWDIVRPGRGGIWNNDARDLIWNQSKWLNKKGPNIEKSPIDTVLEEL